MGCPSKCHLAVLESASLVLPKHLAGISLALAGWHSLLERLEHLSLYAFLTSAAIEERQPKGRAQKAGSEA